MWRPFMFAALLLISLLGLALDAFQHGHLARGLLYLLGALGCAAVLVIPPLVRRRVVRRNAAVPLGRHSRPQA